VADDTGTDWAAEAEWHERQACPAGLPWTGDDPSSDHGHTDCLHHHTAAVGLRRLAQLDTAIEQHRTAHVTEGHPGDEPWSCCNDDFYLWAVLGSGEQPEGPTTPEGELCD